MLELRGVSFAVDGRLLVSDVDLRVASGQIVGLLGPNGAGKSTVLRLAGGLLRPTEGEIFLDGEPLQRVGSRALALRRAVMLPSLAWPDGMTALAAVLLGSSPRLASFGIPGNSDYDLAMYHLAALGVGSLATRDVATLSLGERQRVHLAMVLQQQASLLLLDEPTGAQDFGGITRIARVLRAHSDKGGAVVLALHDINLALQLCDTIALLDHGQLSGPCSPAELVASGRLQQIYGDDIVVASTEAGPVVLPQLRRQAKL
jgi:iron complex transport system ATP-binding protein